MDYSKDGFADDGKDIDRPMNKTPYIEEGTGADLRNGPVGVVDHHAERALCRKFDYRLLPILAWMVRRI